LFSFISPFYFFCFFFFCSFFPLLLFSFLLLLIGCLWSKFFLFSFLLPYYVLNAIWLFQIYFPDSIKTASSLSFLNDKSLLIWIKFWYYILFFCFCLNLKEDQSSCSWSLDHISI
jgi:hypothetical protein